MMERERARLCEIIREKSWKEGEFTLTSGKKSSFYIDCKQTTLSAEGAYLCGRLMYKKIAASVSRIDAVGGMTLGADPLVTAVSIASFLEKKPVPAFIIRKEPKGHGTAAWLEGMSNIPDGGNVALVEDVVTTAGTLIKAIKRTEEAGYRVAMVLTVVDREEGGRELLEKEGYALEALLTKTEIRQPGETSHA
jgi:orotate phosphoribosyltransferase